MKTNLILAAAAIFSTATLRADEAKAKQDQLEAKFKETMAGVVMSGRWCPLKDGVLGEEKEDKYTIVSAAKVSGSSWVINARMKYGDHDFLAQIAVQVKWAGDTAVIIMNELHLLGPNGYGEAAYSARVLVYGNTYAGTWSGAGHGGLLKGTITKEKPADAEAK